MAYEKEELVLKIAVGGGLFLISVGFLVTILDHKIGEYMVQAGLSMIAAGFGIAVWLVTEDD